MNKASEYTINKDITLQLQSRRKGIQSEKKILLSVCNRQPNPVTKGNKDYYRFRFEDFLERYKGCHFPPPEYYLGPLLRIPVNPILHPLDYLFAKDLDDFPYEYERLGKKWKPRTSKSYGYKYCAIFNEILFPELSLQGQEWLMETTLLLQDYMDKGVVEKKFMNNKKYNERNRIHLGNVNEFYSDIELHSSKFRNFAFATHSNAYLDAGLVRLPLSDKIKIATTPEIKEFLDTETWKQIWDVLEVQVQQWNEDVQRAIQEAEKYIYLFKKVYSIWKTANNLLEKLKRKRKYTL